MQTFWAALLWFKVTNLLAAEPSAPPHADRILTYVQAEQSEFRFAQGGADTYSWDVRGWIGGDYDRLWFKTQGGENRCHTHPGRHRAPQTASKTRSL